MSNPEFNTNKIPLGTTIENRYLIKKVIGQGGLGRTYLAVDSHRFNEPCVIKEFAPVGARQYDLEKSRELFIRESKILHQLEHPQIPKFLACFENRDRLLLVQEYVNGKTYSALLERRKKNKKTFSETEIIKWLNNLLPVFSYIHRQNILHRDISPDNIMQPEGGKLPVLIDFGVGKLTNEVTNNRDSYIGQMSFVGKIGYAPREQVTMGVCSPSSDLYGLGVTAIVLLTGKDPTHLLDRHSLKWMWDKYVKVSPALKNILDTMTQEIPHERYQSAQQVLRDIEKNLLNNETFIHPQPNINSSQSPSTSIEKSQNSVVPESTVIFTNENISSTELNPASVPKKPKQEETMIIDNISTNPIAPQPPAPKPKQEETMIIDNISNNPIASQSPAPQPKQEETMIIDNISTNPIASQSPAPQPKQEETMIIDNVNAVTSQSPSRFYPPLTSSTQAKFIDSQSSAAKTPTSQPKIEETVIFNNASSSDSYPPLKSSGSQQNSSLYPTQPTQPKKLSSQFVRLCRQQLNEYLGAVADTVVDDILIRDAPKTPQDLVKAIATKIPNSYQAQQFKQKLWKKLQSQINPN